MVQVKLQMEDTMTEETPTATAEAPAETQETQELQALATQGRAQRPGRVAREVEDCLSIGAASAGEMQADRRMGRPRPWPTSGPATKSNRCSRRNC